MTHIVITNKPNTRKVIEDFIRSRGIDNFVIFTETSELGELVQAMLITSNETFNLHIFDFFGDISLTNAIRDYRDQINALSVFVSCVDDAKPYLTLTERVFVLPDAYNIMSYFWDCDACLAKNVIAFDTSGANFLKLNLPTNTGKTKSLSVDVATQLVPLKYKAANGMIVDTKGTQLVINCKTKTTGIKDKLNVRNQEIVYKRKPTNLDDLAVSPIEEEQSEPIKEKPVKVKAPKPVKIREPKPVKKEKPPKPIAEKAVSDKPAKGTLFNSFFANLSAKKDAPENSIEEAVSDETLAEQLREKLYGKEETVKHYVDDVKPEDNKQVDAMVESGQEPVVQPEQEEIISNKQAVPTAYIGFNNVKHGTEFSTGKVSRLKFDLEEVYDSIAQYLTSKGLVSNKDAAALSEEIGSRPSKDALFGSRALQYGYITEDQLIDAITAVNHIEILRWEIIKDMKLDFTYFDVEKCRQFKFFKLQDSASSERVRIVCAFSITGIHPEVKRLFNNPRISYTLEEYIARRLEGVN